jgi:glycosyltransferase involved in cell wall biosynthesis
MKPFAFKFLSRAVATPTASSWAARADRARDRGDWGGAAQAYRASLDIDDGRADLWVQLGHALKETGDLQGAGEAYQESLDRDPDVADTHLMLGHLFKITHRREEAAAAYARAADLDPGLTDAIKELRLLLRRGVHLDHAVAAGLLGEFRDARKRHAADVALADDGRLTVVFDVADLIGYFRNARLPTGIQRVQIEVIAALLRDPPTDVQIGVCTFAEERHGWVGLPGDLFLQLADLALAAGDRGEPAWRLALEEVTLTTDLAPPLRFPRGAWLVNLGTSWWLQNYFLKVREARRLYGVRYLPFVHDMIPVMAPEHCTRPLTQDFISWALGVFAHTDRFLTNSKASRADLINVARRLGRRVTQAQVKVIPLDADFRKPGIDTPVKSTMERYGLTEGGFVLFVSTIESRKNHLAAFRAFSDLIERHGAVALPKLVCVGNHGWLNDAVFARLESDSALQRQVVMLSGVADADLANLYRTSVFTLYPSQYEGWGLPVTESLCYGRAVLTSDSASLPEAGGAFAAYFHQGDQAGLTTRLERLILDVGWRKSMEAQIEAGFRPRPWRALADDIIGKIRDWSETDAGDFDVPVAEPGRCYPLSRSRETGVGPSVVGSEIFRATGAWDAPEDWGCWTRGEGVIEARVKATGAQRLFLGLRSRPDRPSTWQLDVGGKLLAEGALEADECRWVTRKIPAKLIRNGVVRLRIVSAANESPADGGITLGSMGFMICAESDLAARTSFVEAIVTDDLKAFVRTGAGREA